jgi:hypothetical protein
LLDVLFFDGRKQEVEFPVPRESNQSVGELSDIVDNPDKSSMMYRFFDHKQDPTGTIYFSPDDPTTPGAYGAMYEHGQLVSPVYWGNHWPVTRGKWTGWSINDGIYAAPAHNSVAGWREMPSPLVTSELRMPNALGQTQNLVTQRWVALVARTDLPDAPLLDWAHSFAEPPSLELSGARMDFPSYSRERRALRLVAESASIGISLKPSTVTVNPVFELAGAARTLFEVELNGRSVSREYYTWDGSTLWLNATIRQSGAQLNLRFR